MLEKALVRIRVDASLAMTESSEWREEETRVEDGETDTCNGNHPITVSHLHFAYCVV